MYALDAPDAHFQDAVMIADADEVHATAASQSVLFSPDLFTQSGFRAWIAPASAR